MERSRLSDQVDLVEKMGMLAVMKEKLSEPVPEPVFAYSYLGKSEWGRYVLKQLGAE